MSNSWQLHELKHARLPCPSLSPSICSNSCTLSQWCQLTISSLPSPSLLALNLSQHQGLFQWLGSLHQVTKVLELQLQHQYFQWISCCFSVSQLCPTLCDPMDCSTPGFAILYHLPELAQTHVLWVGDAIKPSWLGMSPTKETSSVVSFSSCL